MRSEARPSPPSGTSRPPGGSRQLARVRRNPDGSTIEPPSDAGLPVWAGHIPARLVFEQPVPAPDLPSGVGPVRADSVVNPAFGSPPL